MLSSRIIAYTLFILSFNEYSFPILSSGRASKAVNVVALKFLTHPNSRNRITVLACDVNLVSEEDTNKELNVGILA